MGLEPMGLEPTTFSLQGNCAPNCATAPCQTAVLQSSRSDTSMCYTFPFEVTAHRELLCRTLHSYSTAGCEFSLTRYPQRLSSLLYGRAIWPRKPRWSSHGDSNSDFHLERVASQPVRGWDDVSRILPYLRGSCDFNRHSRPQGFSLRIFLVPPEEDLGLQTDPNQNQNSFLIFLRLPTYIMAEILCALRYCCIRDWH